MQCTDYKDMIGTVTTVYHLLIPHYRDSKSFTTVNRHCHPHYRGGNSQCHSLVEKTCGTSFIRPVKFLTGCSLASNCSHFRKPKTLKLNTPKSICLNEKNRFVQTKLFQIFLTCYSDHWLTFWEYNQIYNFYQFQVIKISRFGETTSAHNNNTCPSAVLCR